MTACANVIPHATQSAATDHATVRGLTLDEASSAPTGALGGAYGLFSMVTLIASLLGRNDTQFF
jgi:hypothetical protein